MKQIVIVSGKGGTGKTTVTASFAHLARAAVTVDCDVDAANLALLLPGADGPPAAFFAGQRAVVDPDACEGCGLCVSLCRFDAIHQGTAETAAVNELRCEGCGVCRAVCPGGAISLRENQAGVWMVREAASGPLVHARLGIAQDNSGKLVAKVREVARSAARERGLDLVLIDGPPGIGCPVHAAVTGASLLVAVTEPTPSGAHDLERILELGAHFKLPAAVLINKADLSEELSDRIERFAARAGAALLGRLPFDPEVPRLQAHRVPPLPVMPLAEELRKVWLKVHALTMED